ncbi:hypothetical protein [Tabrizicola sp. TH137]|uniref:hypothetical protein n=1 Tax=Tabrizicola sp. TH137 TaxID=2067452 RepID=UPI00117CEC45|nr:hypothetical protein [Tabrizicola sp. TH137]
MTPPPALPEPGDGLPPSIEFPVTETRPRPFLPHRRPIPRKPSLPLEDIALLLVVLGFLAWSVAFAYRMSI